MPIRVEPKSESALDVADWLELQLLVGAAWRVTETNARDFLDRQGLGESFGSSVAGAIVAMRRRSRRLFERYPIIAEAGGFARRSERGVPPLHCPVGCLLQRLGGLGILRCRGRLLV